MPQPHRVPVSLATGEVARRLKISRPTLKNMFGHIPHLYVLKTETRLFPAAYIDAFVAYLGRSKQVAIIDTAASFWRTDEAQSLYAEAVTRFNAGLSGQTLNGTELAAVLGAPYSTIMSWSSSGALLTVGRDRSLLFPCSDVKKAVVWKTPVTRKPYVPPTLPTMFVSATEVNERARRQRRSLPGGTALFGQLQTPGGGRTIPIAYVQALLNGTTGPIDDRLVLRFNTAPATRTIMQEARTEFNRRLAERRDLSPFDDGMLTLEDIAWLLGMTRSMANIWCTSGQLTYVVGPGRKLVRPASLQSRCKWVLPTQR